MKEVRPAGGLLGNTRWLSLQNVKDVYCHAFFDAVGVFSNKPHKEVALHVPHDLMQQFHDSESWCYFTIVDIDTGELLYDTPTKKCATPTIAYDKGKLVFGCETPDVEYVYEIKCSDNVSGRGSEVSLSQTYEIRVRATLDGYEDSDEAVATIGWRNGRPVMEGFSSVTMDGGDGNADVNGDGKVDVADIATVISVMAGQQPE